MKGKRENVRVIVSDKKKELKYFLSRLDELIHAGKEVCNIRSPGVQNWRQSAGVSKEQMSVSHI